MRTHVQSPADQVGRGAYRRISSCKGLADPCGPAPPLPPACWPSTWMDQMRAYLPACGCQGERTKKKPGLHIFARGRCKRMDELGYVSPLAAKHGYFRRLADLSEKCRMKRLHYLKSPNIKKWKASHKHDALSLSIFPLPSM